MNKRSSRKRQKTADGRLTDPNPRKVKDKRENEIHGGYMTTDNSYIETGTTEGIRKPSI